MNFQLNEKWTSMLWHVSRLIIEKLINQNLIELRCLWSMNWKTISLRTNRNLHDSILLRMLKRFFVCKIEGSCSNSFFANTWCIYDILINLTTLNFLFSISIKRNSNLFMSCSIIIWWTINSLISIRHKRCSDWIRE